MIGIQQVFLIKKGTVVKLYIVIVPIIVRTGKTMEGVWGRGVT